MATRSTIAIENEDGSVTSIYCHFDGYFTGVGLTLDEHYRDREKVQSLIALGDLSSLGEHINPPPGTHHTWESPQRNVTVSYHRDRGEDKKEPMFYGNSYEFFKSGERYRYLFTKGGKWVTKFREDPDRIVPLSSILDDSF